MQANISILAAPPKVGKEIQRLRLQNNLTLEQLANKSEIGRASCRERV